MAQACVSLKRMVVDNGDVYWTEYYVPVSAVEELAPPRFVEAFVSQGEVDGEALDVRDGLDALDADPRVVKVVYDSGMPEPGYMQQCGGTADRPQPKQPAQPPLLVPFPPGVRSL